MFCPNCGNKLNGNEEFCASCGNNVNNNKQNLTMSEKMNQNSKEFITPLINKIKSFIVKYRKQLIISCSIIVVLLTGFILFNKFYDFTKISWIEDYGDYKLEYTSANIIELKAEAFDKEENEIKDIEYNTHDGKVEIKEKVVYWTLPDKEGTYEIYAVAPSGKKIKHSIKVVKIDEENNPIMGGLIQEDVDDNLADNDKDNIVNAKEIELGTDPNLADTDRDGLIDSYEIDESKTDPLKEDSDNDGLNDGNELDLGLDPLKEDSKGDGIKDGERNITYTIEETELGISVEMNGKGNISTATIDVFENSTFTEMDGVLDTVYNFYTEGSIESAVVKIKYDVNTLEEKGLSEDNLTFYYFNDDNKKLEAMPTIVDKENKILTITLDHFSKYVIGDKNLVLTDNKTQIMAVIDNSVSMYTYEQLSDAGFYSITGADGNDSEFKRLSLTNNLVDMFTGNYEFGVAEFSGNYVNLESFTDNKQDIKDAVNSMNTKFKSNTTGTNIVTALESSINEFAIDENNHYILLLTDGKDTTYSLSSNKESIIANAKDKEVKICVIGLGSEIDIEDLNEIAESTGCDYYHASNASALDEIYSIVGSDINYNQVDTDGDGKTDGTIIADSGFITSRDGFSFENFGSTYSTNGNCYGMATFAMLRYKNQLPVTLPTKHINMFYSLVVGTIDWNSMGYNLNDTYFVSNKNLYDFNFTDETLKMYFEKGVPSDYRNKIVDKVWMINNKYYQNYQKLGFDIIEKKVKEKDFNKVQSALINIESTKLKNNVSKDEYGVINSIWRLFMLQVEDEELSFSSNNDKTYSLLTGELKSKNPIVIGIGGNHAVNAVRLIQDNNDSNTFKLEIYDNNYPGEIRYINITRSKLSNIIKKWWHSDYDSEYTYTFKYEDYGDKNIDVELYFATIK